MTKLFKNEFKSLMMGGKKVKFLLSFVILVALYLGLALINKVPDGLTAFGESLTFYASLLVFIAPILAGQFVAQNFEDRLIQNYIMNGQKRRSIVLEKGLFLLLVFVAFLLIPSLVATVIIGLIKGWQAPGSSISFASIIVQALLFVFLTAVAYLVVLPTAFHFKVVGKSIGIGLLLSIMVYSLSQNLIQQKALLPYLKLTPLVQSFFVFNESGLGLLIPLAVGLAWLILLIGLTYLIFRKTELK